MQCASAWIEDIGVLRQRTKRRREAGKEKQLLWSEVLLGLWEDEMHNLITVLSKSIQV